MGSYERVNTIDDEDEEQPFVIKFGDIGVRGICRGAIITVSFVALCISLVSCSLSIDVITKRNEAMASLSNSVSSAANAMNIGDNWPQPTSSEPTLPFEEIEDLFSTEAFPTDRTVIELTSGTRREEETITERAIPMTEHIRTESTTLATTGPVSTTSATTTSVTTTPATTTTTPVPTTTPKPTTQPPKIVYEYYDKLELCEYKRVSTSKGFRYNTNNDYNEILMPFDQKKIIISVKCFTYHGEDSSLFRYGDGVYSCLCAGKDYELTASESASQSSVMHPDGFGDDLNVALERLYCYADYLECPI